MSWISIATEVLESTVDAAADLAKEGGSTVLAPILKDIGFATGTAKSLAEEHPVEATIAFVVATFTVEFWLPEAAVEGAASIAGEYVSKTYVGDFLTDLVGAGLYSSGLATETEAGALAADTVQGVTKLIFSKELGDGLEGAANWVISGAENLITPLANTLSAANAILGATDNADGTSENAAKFSDGSTVTSDFGSAGEPTGQDIENANGSSELTTYSSNGTSIRTDYAGANGSGDKTATDEIVPNSEGGDVETITDFSSTGATENQIVIDQHGDGGGTIAENGSSVAFKGFVTPETDELASNVAVQFDNFGSTEAVPTSGPGSDYQITDYVDGQSSLEQYSNLPTGDTEEIVDYSGEDGSGTHTESIIDYSAGGSQEQLLADLPSGDKEEIENFSGPDGTGTDIKNIIDYSTGNSQEQLLADLPAGDDEEIKDFTGTDGNHVQNCNYEIARFSYAYNWFNFSDRFCATNSVS